MGSTSDACRGASVRRGAHASASSRWRDPGAGPSRRGWCSAPWRSARWWWLCWASPLMHQISRRSGRCAGLALARHGLAQHRRRAERAERRVERPGPRHQAPGSCWRGWSPRGQGQGFEVVLVGPLPTAGRRRGSRDSASPRGSTPPASRRTCANGSSAAAARRRRGPSPGSAAPPERTGSPAVAVGSVVRVPADGCSYALYHLFPMEEEQSTLALVRRALLSSGLLLLVLVARRGLAGDPPGGHPGALRPQGRRADRIGPARGADAGARRGRPRPAGRLLQPDGGQPAARDTAAGGDVQLAAALRLRRLPRAAHAVDDRADGG